MVLMVRGWNMEKRMYPRVKTNLPIMIVNQDGDKVETSIQDVSVAGFAVECNIAERNLLTPGGSFVREGKPVKLLVNLDLPDDKGVLNKFEAQCHVAYSRREAKDRCRIGMRFLQLESHIYDKLVEFIGSLLKSASRA